MAVNSQHKDYANSLSIWKKCRDVSSGQEAVHAAGQVYLDKLSGQNDAEYRAYLARALFYNATQRTIDAMSGLLFRKDPQITIPDAVKPWLENIDLNGNTLDNLLQDIADDLLTVGRYGLLVDFPNVAVSSSLTQANAEAENIRPFLVRYKAESIINWATTTINNIKTLALVILEEIYAEPKTEFEYREITQYRVLDLFEGKYRQRVFRKLKQAFILHEEVFPLMNGKNITEIPFIFFSSKDNDSKIQKVPILDLVNVNLSHYKTTADLEHGAHFTGLPTAVITGHRLSENERLRIGSSEAWVFSEPEAKAFYLEFTGVGLTNLLELQKSKEDKMAALGARMLADEKAAAETAETHLIKRQGENSALSTIAEAISSGMTKALEIITVWGGFDPTEVYLEINKDFIPSSMTAQDLTAIVSVWQAGGMAFSDFVSLLQKGELIDIERTPEDIKGDIELEGPTNGQQPGSVPGSNGAADPAL